MPETPPRDFNLPRFGLGGYGRGFALEETALAWNGRDGPLRRTLDDIASIKMEADIGGDDPFAYCNILFGDGTALRIEVVNDAGHRDDSLEYRAFVAAFFSQLGPERRARIDFASGPGPLKRTIQIAFGAVATATFIGLAIFQLFSPDLSQDNNWLLIPLSLLMAALCGGLLYAGVRNRRTPFDPLAVPEAVLPMLKPAPKG